MARAENAYEVDDDVLALESDLVEREAVFVVEAALAYEVVEPVLAYEVVDDYD